MLFQKLVFPLVLSVALSAQAKVEVLFHPTDPTLEKVADWIGEAHRTIDIAMYSMDTTKASPVMKRLAARDVQDRLQAGSLSIRLIFEGYGEKADNDKKMQDLEDLGVDVRFLKSGKIVHHKFAVIDPSETDARVISGSANWSMASYRNYDENMLFFEQEPEAVAQFGQEFETLWANSGEFGKTLSHPARALPDISHAPDHMDVFFNSPRLLFKNMKPEAELTAQVARLIDGAKSEILVASTRVRLEPILNSLKAAAARGVHVKVYISEDDYHDLYKRSDWLVAQPNLELRVKFYNLNPSQYMTYQMHNKFLIIDRNEIGTGSFNWSDSSENGHVENFIELKPALASEVMPSYLKQFDMMWERGRTELPTLQQRVNDAKKAGTLPTCGFSPISLGYDEVRALLNLAPKCGGAS